MQETTTEHLPVALLDVSRGNAPLRDEIIAALSEVYESGRFLYGPQVGELESQIAKLSNTRHAIGCASGSDALLLALMANEIGAGDEVIVPSFTFFATASCVRRLGAKLVFADIDPKTYNICPESVASKITPNTRAIIPVHLFGQSAEIDVICRIAADRDILVIEDTAQALGGAYHGRPLGSWGQIGCTSFYPTKNLGGIGDGGMMTTDSDQIASRLRLLSAHGMQPRYFHRELGINSRLDTLQAAALLVKLKYLPKYTAARQENAKHYFELFHEAGLVGQGASAVVQLPYQDPASFHVWNQFSIRVTEGRRDELRQYLAARAIGSEIYYPIPLHLQECFQDCGYKEGSLPASEAAAGEILHLPIYPELTRAEQAAVVDGITCYLKAARGRKAA
ncbi:MAG: DegT/DnrJ/EryC1/StrS family aminotransferase [Planctomycetales bacterium]|nr:DegT/DnrJ/EryC1/StrS family aminotransferase [Planctomycetales bacterium]